MIPITEPYNYVDLERKTSSTGYRYYVQPDNGRKLTSVTTIMSETDDNEGLKNWRKFVGEEKANKITKEAANIGSLMHLNLENHIMNLERPRGNHPIRVLSRNMANVIIERGLKNVNEIWGIEKMLYMPDLYAGTADLIGLHNDVPCIMDYKTTKKPKTKEQITNYFCQLVAYADAHNDAYKTNINKGVIFMVSRDLEYFEFIIEEEDFDHYRNIWWNRVEKFYLDKLPKE